MNRKKRTTYFLKGMRDGLPIGMGYMAVAFTMGIACRNAGMTVYQSGFMAFLLHASAGEFAAISLIVAQAGILEMIFTQFVINLRYILMSCSLSQRLDAKMPFFHRFLLAFALTDEIFGISMSMPGKLEPFYNYGALTVAVPGWVAGNVLGLLLGNILPVQVVNALGIALYGMFLAVIIPAAKKNRVILGLIIVSMLASSLFAVLPGIRELSSGIRIIILTVLIAGAAAFLYPIKEESEVSHE